MQLTVGVKCSTASDLAAALDTALAKAEETAVSLGTHGILVTRHAYQRFTVEVTPEVPFGLTIERDQCGVRSDLKAGQ